MDVNRVSTDSLELYTLPVIFRLDNVKKLQFSDDQVTPRTRRHYAHHICRYPLDLRAQVQRVLMNQEGPSLAGALQDLFIVLEDKGLKLRTMLFRQVTAQLTEPDQAYFQHWLDHGFFEGYDHRSLPGSVLATGVEQKPLPLVSFTEREVSSYASYYQEAIDCLEYGQLEVAQELLEQEMINPEGDPRTEKELLRVYNYSNDVESQKRLHDLLTGQGRELSEEWTLAINESQKGNSR